jgi:hypothetical protein
MTDIFVNIFSVPFFCTYTYTGSRFVQYVTDQIVRNVLTNPTESTLGQ